MHLHKCNFKDTCQWLGKRDWTPLVTHQPPVERSPWPELEQRFALRDDAQWSTARTYLTQVRQLPEVQIDQLHEQGRIYANPQGNLAFQHLTPNGEVLGASIRSRHGDFQQTLGSKQEAWFFAAAAPQGARQIVAVESPIDALNYLALHPGHSRDNHSIVSVAGIHLPQTLMRLAFEQGSTLTLALDHDIAGREGTRRAQTLCKEFSPYPLPVKIPTAKDWNEDLVHRADMKKKFFLSSQPARHSSRCLYS